MPLGRSRQTDTDRQTHPGAHGFPRKLHDHTASVPRHMGRQTDRWMNRQMDGQKKRAYPGAHGLPRKLQSISNHFNWCPYSIASQTCRQIDHIDGGTGGQTDRLTLGHMVFLENYNPSVTTLIDAHTPSDMWADRQTDGSECRKCTTHTDGWTDGGRTDGQTHPGAHGFPRKLQSMSNQSIGCP